MPDDPILRYQQVHRHACAGPGCQNYYVCYDRDCDTDWTCPSCKDDELADDINRMEQDELNRQHKPTQETNT